MGDGSKSRGPEGGLRAAAERGRTDRNSPDAPNLRQRRRRGCVQRRRSLKPSVMVYPDVLKQKEKINKKNICVGRDGPWQKKKKKKKKKNVGGGGGPRKKKKKKKKKKK